MSNLAKIVSQTRRNHGLEHATIHLLTRRYPQIFLAGHSDAGGFWLLGDVSTEDVETAVQEAEQRLRRGERNLAIHPGCGTNYLVSGGLTAVAGALAMWGTGKSWRDKMERLPYALMLGTVALMFSQPLAYRLQENVTTDGDLGALRVVKIVPSRRGRMAAHRVVTAFEP